MPISSSGHLVVVQRFLGLQVPILFDVILHLGSLFVVLAVFWRDVLRVLKAVVRLDLKSDEGMLGMYIILGSVATAVVGFLFREVFESFFYNLMAVGVAFILMGGFYVLLYVFTRRKRQRRQLSPLSAVLVGIAQGLALIPGISRSGSTIATGLLLKVESKEAFRFSFLLFIPAVIGATVLSALDSESLLAAGIDYATMFVGLAVTVVVGFLFLWLLRRIVLMEKLHLFAYYCLALGVLLVLSQI